MRAREKEGGEGGSVNIKSRRNCLFKSFYHFFSAAGREGAYIMSYKEDFTIYIYKCVSFFSLAYLLRIKNAQNALFSALSRLWRLTVFFSLMVLRERYGRSLARSIIKMFSCIKGAV